MEAYKGLTEVQGYRGSWPGSFVRNEQVLSRGVQYSLSPATLWPWEVKVEDVSPSEPTYSNCGLRPWRGKKHFDLLRLSFLSCVYSKIGKRPTENGKVSFIAMLLKGPTVGRPGTPTSPFLLCVHTKTRFSFYYVYV